ncbi:hypothetical protein [Bacillus sp. FSL R10-2780]|uniref:hypothetical protein n=1 Tax=Bacillus sp. FSL R10-2780 TaxID=2954660 RepID=UPI0030F84D5C
MKYYNHVITDEEYETAEKNGISRANVFQRINERGWDVERAITVPVRKQKSVVNNQVLLLAKRNGISHTTLYGRIKAGMDPYEAVTKPKEHNKWEAFIKMAQENGISASSFYARISRGMDPYEAATKPSKNRKFSTEYKEELKIAKSNGITYQKFYNRVMNLGFDPMEAATKNTIERISNAAIAIKNGISENTYYQRIYKGWSKEDAMTIPVVKSKRYFDREQKANLHRSTTA